MVTPSDVTMPLDMVTRNIHGTAPIIMRPRGADARPPTRVNGEDLLKGKL